MSYIVTDLGEEAVVTFNLDGITLDIGLYNDSTDNVSDSDDLAALSTEPSGSAYTRLSSTFSVVKSGGDWGIQNDSNIQFDVSDSAQTVDGVFCLFTFQAAETSDGSPQPHMVATAPLTDSRDLSQIDLLELNANDIIITVD